MTLAGVCAVAHSKGDKKALAKLDDGRLSQMYDSYGPGKYDLPDQGFIAKVHPLDLWLLGYLLKNPGASLSEMLNAGRFERQEV
ncbi:MAG: hypothetical protein RR194_01970, partial [Ruthenibacterium sp.]